MVPDVSVLPQNPMPDCLLGVMVARIVLKEVSVVFPVYSTKARSLKKNVLGMAAGGRIQVDHGSTINVRALDDVTLVFEHGDRVALLGHNGAGKTTLLQVLAGIYEPANGQVYCEGRIASMLNPMLGMDMESTGYENILQRSLFLGLNFAQIEANIEEIGRFTELGNYLSMPMSTYSSGMAMRLAFAVSTCIHPDILLMDEWLSVGDASFVEKAEKRLSHLVDSSSILVLASHAADLIRRTCNKAVLLERGKVIGFGGIEEVLAVYQARK
jgi:ABC-type polysaccharide/polyol phosphate transport system ATPase subunit